MILACACGGIFELALLGAISASSALSFLFTSWYNRRQYKKYILYKKKHESCGCECHEGEE